MDNNITVIGIGKLGLGLALLIEKAGYNVCGVDIFPDYVKCLNNKTYKTKEPEYEDLLNNSTKFKATVNLETGLDHSDIIFIVVQTPNGGGERFYDHAILSNLLQKINNHKVKNKHIIIGSTVMPKYIDEIGNFLIEDCLNTTLNYNPEFIAQGEIIKGFTHPDIILIGTHYIEVVNILKTIYQKFTKTEPKYCMLKPLEAEIVKISINSYITTKLSFANMISDVCNECNIDKKLVLETIGNDTRIGNKYFKPGYSFGGPCFPRDTKAMELFIKSQNINSDLLKATSLYNEKHIEYQMNQLMKNSTNDYFTFENVCYKENCKIPIIENSAKLKIAEKLARKKKIVTIKDDMETINEVKKEYGSLFKYRIIE